MRLIELLTVARFAENRLRRSKGISACGTCDRQDGSHWQSVAPGAWYRARWTSLWSLDQDLCTRRRRWHETTRQGGDWMHCLKRRMLTWLWACLWRESQGLEAVRLHDLTLQLRVSPFIIRRFPLELSSPYFRWSQCSCSVSLINCTLCVVRRPSPYRHIVNFHRAMYCMIIDNETQS